MGILGEWPPKRMISSDKRKRERTESRQDEKGRKKSRTESHRKKSENSPEKHSPKPRSPASSRAGSPIVNGALPTPPIHPDRLPFFKTAREHKTSPLSPPPWSSEDSATGAVST